jgi:hypothetical protein
MYLTPEEVTLEVAVVSFINVFIVYTAAFSYQVDWRGMVAVIVLASLLTASLNRMLLSNISTTKASKSELVGEAMGILIISILSSLAVFIILIYRFNIAMALGLSILSGVFLSLVRMLTAKL